MTAEAPAGWVSVTDELPKPHYAVEFITTGRASDFEAPRRGSFNGSRFFDLEERKHVDATHWRPVRFFVPHAEDTAQAERVWSATREFLRAYAPTERRVFSLAYQHDGKDCLDIVGRKDRYGMEEILVLLEGAPTDLCCTANRGVLRGEPILIGKSQWDGPSVVEFYPE